MPLNGSKRKGSLSTDDGLEAAFRRAMIKTSNAGSPRRVRPEVRAARWVRRNIGLSAWAFLFALAAAGIGQQRFAENGWHTFRPKARLQAEAGTRAQRTVDQVVRFSVPGLRNGPVSAGFLPEGVAGRFTRDDRSIKIDVGLEGYGDKVYLHTVCHEVVHAMFDQIGAHEYWGAPNPHAILLKEETACDVLGAHIAGQIWSRRGKDGNRLAEELVRDHRRRCDPDDPVSYYQIFARMRDEHGERAVDEDWEYSVFLHHGSPELVDEMDEICRANPNPWDAVRIIKDRYLSFEKPKKKSAREIIEEGR